MFCADMMLDLLSMTESKSYNHVDFPGFFNDTKFIIFFSPFLLMITAHNWQKWKKYISPTMSRP